MYFLLIAEALEKDCIVMNKGATPHASTIRYTVRKGSKGSFNGTQRNGRTRKPITTPARSASAQSSGVAGFFSSQTIVIIITLSTLQFFLVLTSQPGCS